MRHAWDTWVKNSWCYSIYSLSFPVADLALDYGQQLKVNEKLPPKKGFSQGNISLNYTDVSTELKCESSKSKSPCSKLLRCHRLFRCSIIWSNKLIYCHPIIYLIALESDSFSVPYRVHLFCSQVALHA